MPTTRTFNTDDWTGDEISVTYTTDGDGAAEFSMYGYDFVVGAPREIIENVTWRELRSPSWTGPLTTLIADAPQSIEDAVIAAARYVRNHV